MSDTGSNLEGPYPAGPERLPPSPRAVALNNKARTLRASALAGFLLVPNAILAWGWVSGEDLRDLEARGQTVTGQTTGMTYHFSRRTKIYKVEYAYEVRGRNYRNSTEVTALEYSTFTLKHACSVTYLPENPQVSYPGRPGPPLQRHNEMTVVFAALAGGILAVLLTALEIGVRRERYLAREGEPVVGHITDRGTSRARNRTNYWVYHEFISPADEPITAWHYVPAFLWERLRPGLSVTILYDPANAKRHLPLYAFKYAFVVEQENIDEAST
jgi:hypothetical protein